MSSAPPQLLRPDYVPAADYISDTFAALEREKLWPKVWLIAAREEQLKEKGDFVRFDIGGESIVIVRKKDDSLGAFYNVCQHRGRMLVEEETGNLKGQFNCRYHNWSYDYDGRPRHIRNREDWDGCPDVSDEALSLKKLRIDTWGGWVWVAMDPDIEPLHDYLAPIPEALNPFEFENCRITWHVTQRVNCNWKTGIEAFNEAYHVEGTHPQMVKYGGTLAKAPAYPVGKHASIRISRNSISQANPLITAKKDPRQNIVDATRELAPTLKALYVDHYERAAERLLAEVAPDADVGKEFRRLHMEEMALAGARWPATLTDEHIAEVGDTWHIFPNSVLLASFNGALWYRCRPVDTEWCLFDIWWLGRHAPGKEPPFEHQYFPSVASFKGTNPFLEQDFSNMESVQRGMRSRGFTAARTNPLQEAAISNLHRVIYDYVYRTDATRAE